MKVNCMKLGNPDKPHTWRSPWNGIPSVSEGEGLAGIGTKRKRMPPSNRVDRGFYNERIIYRRDTPS